MSSFERSSDDYLQGRDIPSFIEARPPLVNGPGQRPRPFNATNLLDVFESESIVEDDVVQVYLRVKPCKEPSSLYEIRSDTELVSIGEPSGDGGKRAQCSVSKTHRFSHIFPPNASQKQIFDHVVKGKLRKLTEGHSYTLLTYGASGSGKTYTLMGTEEQPGLIPRSLEYMFKLISPAQHPMHKPKDGVYETLNPAQQASELEVVSRLRRSVPLRPARRLYRRMSQRLSADFNSLSDLNATTHYVWVSFVEIYNEAIYDLLERPDKTRFGGKPPTKLRICEDPNGTTYVKGATQAFVRTGSEAYDVMAVGRQNLRVAATGVHQHSSRSHCIFTITLVSEARDGITSTYVRLCDLAGSERAGRTHNAGLRMTESCAINSSLHVLERCLFTLRRKQRAAGNMDLSAANIRVPIRESKLTRLLGAGLLGTCHEAVGMVVTVNPSALYAQETRHVLQLAAVASHISVNPIVPERSTLDNSDDSAERDAELLMLRAENERLQFEINSLYERVEKMNGEVAATRAESAHTMQELVDEARQATELYYTQQMALLESRHAREKERLREELNEQISQLIIENTKLKEQLKQQPLEMAVVESEIEHLHACLAERDHVAESQEQEKAEQKEVVAPAHPVWVLDDSGSSSDEYDSSSDDGALGTITEEDSNVGSSRSTMDKVLRDGSTEGVEKDHFDECTEDADSSGEDEGIELNRVSVASNLEKRLSEINISNIPIKEENDSSKTGSFNESKNTEITSQTTRFESLDKRDSFLEVENEINQQMESVGKYKKEDTKQSKLDDLPPSYVQRNQTGNFVSLNNILRKLHDDEFKAQNLQEETISPGLVADSTKKDNENEEQTRLHLNSVILNSEKNINNRNELRNDPSEVKEVSNLSVELDTVTNADEHINTTDRAVSSNHESCNKHSIQFENINTKKSRKTFTVTSQSVLSEYDPVMTDGTNSTEETLKVVVAKKDASPESSQGSDNNCTETITHTICKTTPPKQPGHISAVNKQEKGGILAMCRPKSSVNMFESERCSIETHCRNTFSVFQNTSQSRNSSLLDLMPRRDNSESILENNYIEHSKDTTLPYAQPRSEIETVTQNKTDENDIACGNRSNLEDEPRCIGNDSDFEIYFKPEAKFSLSKDLNNIIGSFNFHTKREETEEKTTECKKKNERKKMSLKLRNRTSAKLKDIANLQKEFSDVTLGVPSTKKLVADIPSPDKTRDVENLSPPTAVTCPAKSTRSRRKLFTPRAEALDDSVASDDDGNLRIKIRRPSYHRATRARRKL